MAGTDRTATDDLAFLRELAEKPYRHSLYGVLRRLEKAAAKGHRFGESVRPSEDPIRLGQKPSLAFAPSELAALVPGSEGRPDRLEIFGFGLLGPQGPLPTHLTEHVFQRRENADDPTISRFLDLFHHRMISLFYRAWANSEPAAGNIGEGEEPFGEFIGPLVGLGFDSLRDRDALPDAVKFHHAGRLALQTRPPGPLRQMLEEHFDVKADIEEFVGEWLDLPDEQCWRLGESPETGTLGVSATAGTRVWSRSHRFRIVLGPLSLEKFERFLPGAEPLEQLVALVRTYAGDELRWDLNLVLKKEEVPSTQLGRAGQLGRTSWFTTEGRAADAADAVIDPQPMESR